MLLQFLCKHITQVSREKKECSESKYHEFVAGKCVPKECAKPFIVNAKTVIPSSLHGYKLVIGSIVTIICNKGYISYRSNYGNVRIKQTKMVCRFDEIIHSPIFTQLDGSLNPNCIPGNIKWIYFQQNVLTFSLHISKMKEVRIFEINQLKQFVSGCFSSRDCNYYEECLQGQCATIKCHPMDAIPNGVLELTHGTVMFRGNKRNTAKFFCERGYVFSDRPDLRVR